MKLSKEQKVGAVNHPRMAKKIISAWIDYIDNGMSRTHIKLLWMLLASFKAHYKKTYLEYLYDAFVS